MTARLFTALALRSVVLANRIVVAPMCQYAAVDGVPGDWHLMHLGHLALQGPGLLIAEATGVEPAGRITPGCTGLWSDAQEAAFARILAFCRSVSGARLGIQLAHSGRKGSTTAPWLGGGPLAGPAAWQTEGSSALAYLPGWAAPRALDAAGLVRICDAFAAAACRAVRAGFDLVELHAAHGYLLHQFLSPLANRREDAWGGSRERRMRFPLEVFSAVRGAVPPDRPVGVRISATDWVAGGADLEDAIAFALELRSAGCDLLHVTSGGLTQDQKIVTGPGYQTGFAAELRRATGLPVIAVGQITEPLQAETILATGQADMVALARGMLWEPRWVWKAALALGAEAELPPQYARAHPALRAKPFVKRS
jgi:NADPH2 dehydrogenase